MISIVAFVILFGVTDLGISILEQTPFSHIATRIANAKNPYNDVYGQGYQRPMLYMALPAAVSLERESVDLCENMDI